MVSSNAYSAPVLDFFPTVMWAVGTVGLSIVYSLVVVTDSNNNFKLADLYSNCMTDYGGEIKLYKHT